MSDIDPFGPARMSRARRITIAGLVTAGLSTGGAFAANAAFASGGSSNGSTPSAGSSSSATPPAPPKGGPIGAPGTNDLDGTVTAASSGSLTVHDLFGTSRTYTTTSSTQVRDGATKASVSSLTVGQHVLVHGTKSGSTYRASSVDVRAAHIDGAVSAVSGDSITVTDNDGFARTVSVSSSTKYTKDGASAQQSAVVQGSVVHAEGTVDADHTTLDATTVNVLTKAPAPPAGGRAGARPGPGAGPAAPRNGSAPTGKAPGGKAPVGKAPAGKAPTGKLPAPPKGGPGNASAPKAAPSASPSGR